MAYKDKEKKRAYQRRWKRERRNYFFSDKCCEDCGATENLELHHLDPSQKEASVIWSWSKKRREKEIAKCAVLCHDCHVERHKQMGSFNGEKNSQSILTEKQVKEIKILLKSGVRQVDIAKKYNVSKYVIYNIKSERNWTHVKI